MEQLDYYNSSNTQWKLTMVDTEKFFWDKTTNILNVSGQGVVTNEATINGAGATVTFAATANVDSDFGSSDYSNPASAQAIRGRITGNDLTGTNNYLIGVTGQYLITGSNASEFPKAGILGVVGDQTTSADAAIIAYLDGDGGLTTAGAAYAVGMKNSTPGSGFDYGLDLKWLDLGLIDTDSPFAKADIRFNNGVELVARDANNVTINANIDLGSVTSNRLEVQNETVLNGNVTINGILNLSEHLTDLTVKNDAKICGNAHILNNLDVFGLANVETLNTINLCAVKNVEAEFLKGDGSNIRNINAKTIDILSGNPESLQVFYPVFSSLAGVDTPIKLYNLDNKIEFEPTLGELSFKQAKVSTITGGSEERIDFDTENNKINVSVTGKPNVISVSNESMSLDMPLQLAVYISNAARDTAIPNPKTGMMIFVIGDGMQVFGAADWNTIGHTFA